MADMYDVVILGSGPGGYVAAIRAAQLGLSVAVVEMERVGGCCLNRGCIPTKTLYRSVENYIDVLRAAEFGVDVAGPVSVNFSRIIARKNEVVESLVRTVTELMKAHRIDIYDGFGTFVAPGQVRVAPSRSFPDIQQQTIRGRKIIIATGSRTARVPISGTDLPGVVTSRGILNLSRLPQRLIVVGASFVGLEFASMFAALGTKVAVLERDTFMRAAEDQLAKRLRSVMTRNGIGVTVGVEVCRIGQADDGHLQVTYQQDGKDRVIDGDVVLLSAGRTPYTEGLGVPELKKDGVRVLVNERMETNIPDVYAVGDVLGTQMMAHVASYEAEVAVDNIAGKPRAADYHAVPYCVFTIPEIAGVGLTERKAKELGLPHVVERFPFSASGKALAMGEQEGQIRIIAEKNGEGRGGRVLGVHIMGARASDLIAEATTAMQLNATAAELAETIHAHPTLPEAFMEAAKAVAFGEAIHYRKV